MRIIRRVTSGDKAILDTLGIQNIRYANKKYRLSKYVVTHIPEDDPTTMLLLNTVTGTIISITNTEYDDVVADKIKNTNNFLYFYLIQYWFLVPEDFDEKTMVNLIRNTMYNTVPLTSYNDQIDHYVILTTTGCNARCSYCYQCGTRTEVMTSKTADQVVKFIMKHSAKAKKTPNISWFGGEPLSNFNAIVEITEKLNKNNFKFTSSIITNGYLLCKEVADYLKDNAYLGHAQITIDGVGEEYNKVKNYVYKQTDPFDIVIKNLKYALEKGIRISVRLNVGPDNLEQLKAVSDYIYNNVWNELAEKTQTRLSLYTHSLYEEFDKEVLAIIHKNRLELNKYIFDQFGIDSRFIRTAYYHTTEGIKAQSCMSDNPYSVMINPLGQIGKCEHHVLDDLYGTIWDDSNLSIDFNAIMHWQYIKDEIPELCDNCKYYPSCINSKDCKGCEFCCEDRLKTLDYETQYKIEFEYREAMRNDINDVHLEFDLGNTSNDDIDLSEIQTLEIDNDNYYILNTMNVFNDNYVAMIKTNSIDPTIEVLRYKFDDNNGLDLFEIEVLEEYIVVFNIFSRLIDKRIINKIISNKGGE